MPSGTPLAASSFRISDLDDRAVWTIAQEAIVDRPVVGRGDLAARGVYEIGLTFEVDDVPPRHANIIGWQGDKQDWLALALRLEDGGHVVRPGGGGACRALPPTRFE